MTREELLLLINLSEELVPAGRPNRPGSAIRVEKITIHNTSNSNAGANARMHSKFVRETGFYMLNGTKRWVSWHYSVDDKQAIRQLPDKERGFHAGTQGNGTSIAMEVCMHNGIDQEAANTRASQLTALLCFDFGLPVASVVTHKFWTGKNCPVLILTNWNKFIDQVRFYLEKLKQPVPIPSGAIKGVNSSQPLSENDSLLCWNDTSADTPQVGDEQLLNDELRSSLVQNAFDSRFLPNGSVELPSLDNTHPDFTNYVFIHHQNMSIYFN